MKDETANPNIQWKKNKGFSSTEKLSRKIDKEKALEEDAKAKHPISLTKAKKSAIKYLPKGLKKIRKKIKDVYDEDEDEDELYSFAPDLLSSSLVNALHDSEKKQLGLQEQTISNQRLQQDAGRQEAIMMANKLSREFGFGDIDAKIINKSSQDATMTSRDFEKILKDDVMAKAKISTRQLSRTETVSLLRGIKRIKQVAIQGKDTDIRAIEGLKIDDIIDAGDRNADDSKVAEIILKKSGRKNKKQTAKTIKKKAVNLSKKNKDTIRKIEKGRC